jgi:hypothetical protein
LVRVNGFEPLSPLWKSGVLPLNDTRVAKGDDLSIFT